MFANGCMTSEAMFRAWIHCSSEAMYLSLKNALRLRGNVFGVRRKYCGLEEMCLSGKNTLRLRGNVFGV